jgi:hypothetical protein
MSADVVDVVKDGSDTGGDETIHVMQRSEEHASEKLGRTTLIMKGRSQGVSRRVVMGIKLR